MEKFPPSLISIVLDPMWRDHFHGGYSSWTVQLCPILFQAWKCLSRSISFLNLVRGMTNEWPTANLLAQVPTMSALAKHTRSLLWFHHSMLLYIDMKIILPGNCSGSQHKVSINFWISRRICSVVCPGLIIHSNSIGSPSNPSNSLYWLVLVNHSSLCAHSMLACGYSRVFPTHNTEPEKTWTSAFTSLITSSSFTRDSLCHVEVLQLNSDTPEISQFCSRINFWDTSNNFCTVGFWSVFLTECRFWKSNLFTRKMAACTDEVMNIHQIRESLSYLPSHPLEDDWTLLAILHSLFLWMKLMW